MDVTNPGGTPPPPADRESSTGDSTYVLSRWLFLRLLGLVYLIAFGSLALHGPGGRARDPPRHRVPRAGARAVRGRRLPAVPDLVLAGCRGWGSPDPLLGRRDTCPAADRRGGAGAGARAPLGVLPVAQCRGSDLPVVSMGWAAARGGPARAAVRAHAVAAEPRAGAGAVAGAALARVAAPLQADVPLRDHEARERRPEVASPHGARLPLLDAAVAAVDGVVRAAAPGVDAPGHDAGNIRDRVGRALAHLRAIPLPPVAHRGVRVARARTARHRGHRELRVLQPARARAVRLAARRCHVAPVAASAASRGGAGAAVATRSSGRSSRRYRAAVRRSRTRCSAPSPRSARSTATGCFAS